MLEKILQIIFIYFLYKIINKFLNFLWKFIFKMIKMIRIGVFFK